MKYDIREFVEILEIIKENLTRFMDISEIRALETNPRTQVVEFRSKSNKKSGMIVVGENNDKIVVEVIVDDEKDNNKGTPLLEMNKINTELIDELVGWFEKHYK